MNAPGGGKAATEPREIRSPIPADSYGRGLLVPLAIFGLWSGLYLAAWVAVFVIPGPARLVAALLAGVFLSVLFVAGHDACHGAFLSSRPLNHFVGRLAFLPALHPFSFWEYAHNRIHHGWTNLKSKDYVWAPFSKEEFARLRPWRRAVERIGRTFFGVGVHYIVAIWWPHLVFPRPEDRKHVNPWLGWLDRLGVAAFLVAQVLVAFGLESRRVVHASPAWCLASAVILGVAVPFFVFAWMVGIVTFMHHNHERVRWYDRREEWSFSKGACFGTVHVEFPRAVDLFLLNIMFHTAHHVDVRIPLYRLPRAQRALEEAHGDRIICAPFTLSSALRVFRQCKLYDYRRHVWLDFAGNPATSSDVPGQPTGGTAASLEKIARATSPIVG